ncbi:MAG: class I SAM-dependent methyltransferase [Pseudonocardia sp.]|nr:class I SAM-dependent methyltransferase [Pseudonocardia sp.]
MDDERARRSLVFGSVAATYAEHRPGYPPEAVAWALQPLVAPAPDLLDLAAGTGKLTKALVDVPYATVTAVEPDPAMLAELRDRFPRVRAVEGTAEAIPLPDASVDAVLAGTAWHWFDPEPAVAEIARVLRPGGVLTNLWNGDDTDVEWVHGFHEAAARGRPVGFKPPAPGADVFPPHPAFTAAEQSEFRHGLPTTVDGLLANLSTHSWALISEPADRDAAFDRIRAYLATRPETSGGRFTLPLVTGAVRALRR